MYALTLSPPCPEPQSEFMEQGLLGRLCPVADSVEGGWAIWPPPPIGAGNGPTKLLGEQLVHPAPPFFYRAMLAQSAVMRQ